MNYLRGALNAASQYYRDINPSTLTGAIDVIVVRRPVQTVQGSDGGGVEELACSPFHVRFGKWQVLRPTDKKVKVMVNGREIPFSMKIGDAGEAFFVFETDEDVPEDLITSPLLEATHPEGVDNGVDMRRSSTRDEEKSQERPMAPEPLDEPEPLDLDSPSTSATDSTPRPSGLSRMRPSSSPATPSPASKSKPDEEEDTKEEGSSSGTLGFVSRKAGLGKAVVKAAVEADRYERQQVRVRAEAARNAASRTYDSFKGGSGLFANGEAEPGDEALPPVKAGQGQPPDIVFSHNAVIDVSGYHAQTQPKKGSRSGPRDRSPSTIDEETDDYDSYESRSSPRSGDVSSPVTPTQSPDTSRSSSPGVHPGSLKQDRSLALPPLRAASEPPDTDRSVDGPPRTTYSWEWGGFPTTSPMQSTFSPTKLEPLETQRSLSVPPELSPDADISRPSTPPRSKTGDAYPSPPDTPRSESFSFLEGDNGLTADETNGRRFLHLISGRMQDFELSISEELAQAEGHGSGDEVLDARCFRDGQVSFRRFIKYSGVVYDPNLVIKWNNKYVTRKDKSLLFDCLVKWREAALAKPVNAKALEEEEPLSSSDEQEPEPGRQQAAPKKSSSSWVRWWRSSRKETPQKPQLQSNSTDTTPKAARDGESTRKPGSRRPSLIQSSSAPSPNTHGRSNTLPFPTMSEPQLNVGATSESRPESRERRKRFAKTLRLTSDQLKELELKAGNNTITFSLSASGTTACTASIFLWEATDSIVVSDIDGTITKSDALGHVFTMIGRDWTHIGVAKLYTDIARNGYRIMYLTSRAIGQADSTRYYLKSINQNNYQLPEGPVIMSPDRLMASFHREVIMRKPEMFKMACLRDIQRLFGEGGNPFYAGFGNRITDALSYRSVNIPSQRIFTIDSSGEVKMELLEVAGYKSSYIHLTDLVDQMFPPVQRKSNTEYSDVNYWKTPIQEYPLPDLTPEPASPALSARSDTSTSTFSRLRNFSLRQSTSSFFQSSQQDGSGGILPVTSAEHLTSRFTRSTETLVEHEWSDEDRGRGMSRFRTVMDETSRERRTRNRLSIESMPGSLDGSEADFETDEEGRVEDEDNEGQRDEGNGEGYEREPEDPEAAAEEGFDDDLLATGEMESVPYL